jgi:ABC-type molybdenum transport system ATPase subunit/photorepair protein PhrA
LTPVPAEVPRLDGVTVRRSGRTILGPIDWTVRAGERWVFGPYGSGKATLLQVASTYLWPSTGGVHVLGQPIGAVDARQLRESIGYAGSGMERAITMEHVNGRLAARGADAVTPAPPASEGRVTIASSRPRRVPG